MGADAIHSADDARRIARRRLPWMVFDYIDGAAGRETGAARNRAALDAMTLRPRILRDVSQRSLATTIFGAPAERPFGIAPMGMCNMSALSCGFNGSLQHRLQMSLLVSDIARSFLVAR